MKIAVAGTGYVGLSIATLLSQHHEVMAVDIIPEKVDLINHRKSPIQDEYIEKYLRFLYKGIIIKHNKTEPTYTKTSLFLCEKRRFFMARTEKGVVATI